MTSADDVVGPTTGSEVGDYRTVVYGPGPAQFIEWWDPKAATGNAVAVLVHGGYWRDAYGLDLMHPMARHLVGRGWSVANVEYRRLDEPVGSNDGDVEPDPDIWDKMSSDVAAALAAIDTDVRPTGHPIVAIGHSAGGQLALWAATLGQIDAVVALAPVADLVAADRLNLSTGVVRRLLGGDSESREPRYRAASPMARLPLGVPQMIVHGRVDENVPHDMAVAYHAAAVDAGDVAVLHDPVDVDHFHVIDPAHGVWRAIDGWLSEFLTSR